MLHNVLSLGFQKLVAASVFTRASLETELQEKDVGQLVQAAIPGKQSMEKKETGDFEEEAQCRITP